MSLLGYFISALLVSSCYERVNHKGEFDYDEVKASFYYDLNDPDDHMRLTSELEEISGLTWVNDTLMGAVQDEVGHLYYLDPKDGDVTAEIRFEAEGDYEGVEMANGEMYAIKSNGKLYRFAISDKDEEAKFHDNPLNVTNNVEGLGYWPERNMLLIGCKEKQVLDLDDDEEEDKEKEEEDDEDETDEDDLLIYGFDIEQKLFIEEPLIVVHEDNIEEQFENEYKGKFDGKKFALSAMAYHPIEKTLYMVSSAARLMIITDMQGKIQGLYPLDREVLRQPEGICFTPDGTLYIASEGRGGAGYIVKYRYRK
ncbi:MAG: SdiA-regulated domain-containing protein [Cyclobacteriaceae bacterium]